MLDNQLNDCVFVFKVSEPYQVDTPRSITHDIPSRRLRALERDGKHVADAP